MRCVFRPLSCCDLLSAEASHVFAWLKAKFFSTATKVRQGPGEEGKDFVPIGATDFMFGEEGYQARQQGLLGGTSSTVLEP